MGHTLEDLRDDVRDRLDETNAQYWTNPELDRYLNEAVRDMARRTESLQGIKVHDVETNRPTYDAPKDMIRIYRIEYHQSSDYIISLEYQPFNEMDSIWFTSRDVPGTFPYFYSLWGAPSAENTSQIYLYPIPGEDIGEGLHIFYYRMPKPMSQDSDPAEIPNGWEDLVPLYCEHVARRKEGDPRWKDAYELYVERLDDMHRVTRHYSDQERFVVGQTGGAGRLPYFLAGGDWDW